SRAEGVQSRPFPAFACPRSPPRRVPCCRAVLTPLARSEQRQSKIRSSNCGGIHQECRDHRLPEGSVPALCSLRFTPTPQTTVSLTGPVLRQFLRRERSDRPIHAIGRC